MVRSVYMEITLSLSLRKRDGKSQLVYTISPAYRIVMCIIFLLIATAVFTSKPVSMSGIAVLSVCFLALLYEERWIFDTEARTISYHFGLICINKKRIYQLNEIENMSINHFARGKLNQSALPEPEKMPFGSQTRLILNLTSGQAVLINTTSFNRRKKVIDDAETIANYMQLPLNFDN